MSKIRDEVNMFAEGPDFDPDSLNYTDCPECGGERKLLVVRQETGSLFYKCFRASCGVSGGAKGAKVSPKVGPTAPKRKVYEPSEVRDANVAQDYLRSAYHLTKPAARLLCRGYAPGSRSSVNQGLFIFPVWGPRGSIRGEVLRRFDKSPYNKVTHPADEESPLTSWYWGETHTPSVWVPLVLVEDQISAARLSEHYATVALLGTVLSNEALTEICNAIRPESPLIIILDADATVNAVKMRKQVQLHHSRTYIIPLHGPDIKDMSPGEFTAIRAAIATHE